jgi:chemotaxis signal transduction protein
VVSTAARPQPGETQRLVLFEVAGTAFAIAIADVLEVTESGSIAAIPGLPRETAWVMNHHGEALPLVSREALFELPGADADPAGHVIVLAARGGEAGWLGVPVDSVVGLVDAAVTAAGGQGLVVDRLPLRGRITSVVDARRLLERAAWLIEASNVPVAAR